MKTTSICSGLAIPSMVLALTVIAGADGGRGGVALGSGSTLEVDVNDPQCGQAGQPFCQIQDAIAAAVAGDTIEVDDGVYLPFTVPAGKDGLTIENDSDPIIDGGGAGVVVTIAADGVKLEGFEIRNGDVGIQVTMTAENVEIEDCFVHDNAMRGIEVLGQSCEIEDNELANNGLCEILICDSSGNCIEDNEIQNSARDGTGIRTAGTSQSNTIEGNRLQGPGVPVFLNIGIALGGHGLSVLCDNEVNGMGNTGIEVMSPGNTVEGNCAEGCGDDGFEIASANNVVCENFSGGNGACGISIDAANMVIGNVSEGNAEEGFNITGAGNVVCENVSCGNEGRGYEIDDDGNILEDNVADGNTREGFCVDSSNNVLCENESTNNLLGGFVITGLADGSLFEDNESEDNGGDGFAVSGDDNTFTDNEAEGNAGFGINDSGNGNQFDGNECDDNDAGDSNPPGLCD